MNEYCKICGFKTRVIFHKKFEVKYYVCNQCDFISKDENSIITSDEELRIYNNHNNSIDDPHYVAYFKNFINKAILEYCSPDRHGFDFGSGPSPVLATILARDYDYFMDIYDKFYSPEKTYIGKKYSLITSTEVVEHLNDPLHYFKLFKELCAENGILSIMTLFHQKNDNEFLKWFYMRDMSHVSFYTPKTMHHIGEKIGLKVIYTDNKRYTTFRPIG